MSERMKREMNKIDIPDELDERSRRGIGKAMREKPVRNRLPVRAIALVAALFLLIGGGVVVTIFAPPQGDYSSPESSSSSESANTEESSSSESSGREGMLVVNDRLYIETGREDVELNEKLGTVREKIPTGEQPMQNFTSNVLEEGSVIYNTDEEGVLAVRLPDNTLLKFVREDIIR